MNISDLVEEISDSLKTLSKVDLGYPKGINEVHRSVRSNSNAIRICDIHDESLRALNQFYICCDGMSLPDVDEGIFILCSSDIGKLKDEFTPAQVHNNKTKILVLGSFGDGSYIALNKENGVVLKMPPSKILKNEYFESDFNPILILEKSLSCFLSKIAILIRQNHT